MLNWKRRKKYPFYYHFGIVDIVDVDNTVREMGERERLCVVAEVSAGEEECCDVLSGEADLHDTV